MAALTAPCVRQSQTRSQYPRPSFSRQPQSVPSVAAKMDPVPDHGEYTHQGSSKLKDCKALVTGGASGTGCAAAIAFAPECAEVADS